MYVEFGERMVLSIGVSSRVVLVFSVSGFIMTKSDVSSVRPLICMASSSSMSFGSK